MRRRKHQPAVPIYPGTMLHAKLPSAASAMVNAGLKLAPDAAPKIKAGTSTARPQAKCDLDCTGTFHAGFVRG